MAIVESNGNDVSTPMKIGDERKFVIYKKNKPNCGLFTEDDSEKVEIMIKKPRDREFHVDGYATAHIECYPGHVTQLKSRGKTEQCGIGKILMQLCLIEIDIHNVHYERNYVLGEISTFEALCKLSFNDFYKSLFFLNNSQCPIDPCAKNMTHLN